MAGDLWELTKPRLTTLVIATAVVGFFVGSPAQVDWAAGFFMTLGMMGVVGGGNALNEYWERDVDARMKRTRKRPLPSGTMAPHTALIFGLVISALGLLLLDTVVNRPAMLAALSGWVSYVLIYTPRPSSAPRPRRLIGAFPGAVPPLVGWAAARGTRWSSGAWVLFSQLSSCGRCRTSLPSHAHFREDYARGGFPMLGVRDADGAITNRLSTPPMRHCCMVPLGVLPDSCSASPATSYLVGSLAARHRFLRHHGVGA